MPAAQAGGRHAQRQAAEHEPDQLDQHDAETERHQELVLRRAGVEMADDDELDQSSDDEQEQRPGDDGDGEGAGRLERDEAGIAAEHEHGAVRQVEDAERAVDDGEAGADQRQQRT